MAPHKSRVVMETLDGDLLIQVLDCAYIEREKVDVIVNSISPTMQLNGRKLSSAIGASAGPSLQRALRAVYTLPQRPKPGDVVATPGFGLKCQFIYHIIATGYRTENAEDKMEESVLQCLKMANNKGLSSIAIPALGSGGLGFPPDVVAQHMLRAVACFKQSVGSSAQLRQVRFALMETAVRVAFIKRLSGNQDSGHTLPVVREVPNTISQIDVLPIPHTVLKIIEQYYRRTQSSSFRAPFIPWRWTGTLGRARHESEWLDALQEDLFMIRPRSPIILHGAAGIGKTRFLDQIKELWMQGSLPKFSCMLQISAFAILRLKSLRDTLWHHLVDDIRLDGQMTTDLMRNHSQGLLVLVDDADLLNEEHLRQSVSEPDLSQMNFVFSVRTPDAPRITSFLNPSDIVELKCFTPLEVERYVTAALKGERENMTSLIDSVTSIPNLLICSIPGNLRLLCHLLRQSPELVFKGKLHELLLTWLKTTRHETAATYATEGFWHTQLEDQNWAVGKYFYNYFTSATKPSPTSKWLEAVKGPDGRELRQVVDFAIGSYIASVDIAENILSCCSTLQTCFRLQIALQLACGMSPAVSTMVQTHVLYLAEKDLDVQHAREEVLDLDDKNAMTLRLLVHLQEGCRRESTATATKGVPTELQHLGPEYVLAYERACVAGSQSVFCMRVMIVGHFGAGKTSVKRRLLNEPFQVEYKTTNGIEADPSACRVSIDNTCNWHLRDKETPEREEEYSQEVARVLYSLMQRLKPAQVLGVGHDHQLRKIARKFAKIGDEVQSTYIHDRGLLQNVGTMVKDALNTTNVTNVNTDDPPETFEMEDLSSLSDLLQRQVPPEVLHHLCNMIKCADSGAQPGPEQPEIKLSFWDFAGQAVFYTTHQTFLTHRAVYLLVLDLRLSLDSAIYTYRQGRYKKELDKTCPQTVADYLDYWLNCIHTHAMSRGFNPNVATLSPPVIIVGTHKDVVQEQYPDRAAQHINDFYGTVHKYIECKAYFDHVHLQFISVANNMDDDPEVDRLRQTIIDLARQQPHWGEEIPLRWTALRDRLRQQRHSGLSVMAFSDVLELAAQADIPTKEELHTVLRFYHELGELVFFDEPSLQDLIILDPQWLIDAFRKVITVNIFHEQHAFPKIRRHWRMLEEHGVLHGQVLEHVWDPALRSQLIMLMEKFRLLIRLPYSQLCEICPGYADMDSQAGAGGAEAGIERTAAAIGAGAEGSCAEVAYLVPCLLPPVIDPPEFPNSVPPVLIVFQEDFLPVGVMSRLITGLAMDEGWMLSGKVYHNHVMFLPRGLEDTSIGISIYQHPEMLELQGVLLGDSLETVPFGIFHPFLLVLTRLLQNIVHVVCPSARFVLAVRCRCPHQENHNRKAVWIGSEGELIEGQQKMYCSRHWREFSTVPFSPWFNVQVPPPTPPIITEYPSDAALLSLSEQIGVEWMQLAVHLGLSSVQRQQALGSHPHNIVMCVHSLLVKWRKASPLDGAGKLQHLEQALIAAGRRDLAEELVLLLGQVPQ